MGIFDINPNKFIWNGKESKSKGSILARLSQEPFNVRARGHQLIDYFCYRDLAVALMRADPKNFVLAGSNSIPAFVDAYRVPSDLDMETLDAERATECLMDVISDFNSDSDVIKYSFKKDDLKLVTGNKILTGKLKANIMGLDQSIKVDIAERSHFTSSELRVLGKVISNDSEHSVNVIAPENFIVRKSFAILERLSYQPGRDAYSVKDFYDIHRLLSLGVDEKEVARFVKVELESRKEFSSLYKDSTDQIKQSQASIEERTKGIGEAWRKFEEKIAYGKDANTTSADIDSVASSSINFVKNLEL